MPSTLRYGSGLLDIPVASVLPHMAIVGTYSGFAVSIVETIALDRKGQPSGPGEPHEKWVSDGAVAIGLFDRVELGATIQHLDTEENGGNMLGGFARVSLLPASLGYVDLAVGARYLSSPSYGDGYLDGLQPGRLGHPDYRLHNEASGFQGGQHQPDAVRRGVRTCPAIREAGPYPDRGLGHGPVLGRRRPGLLRRGGRGRDLRGSRASHEAG